MAIGGVLNEVWMLSATRMPNRVGSIWKVLTSGRKIGTKMMMISVHSSGQPSRKMMNWARIRKPVAFRFAASTQCSITSWPPR